MLNLLMAPKSNDMKICRIKCKRDCDNHVRHLNNLGFVEGAKICVVSENAGDLIVKVKDCRVASGKEIAKTHREEKWRH